MMLFTLSVEGDLPELEDSVETQELRIVQKSTLVDSV